MRAVNRIPVFLRAGPLQALTMALLSIGGVLGMISSRGAVLLEEGHFEVSHAALGGAIACVIATFLLFITALVKPVEIQMVYRQQNLQWGLFMAFVYMAAGIGLMIFNWIRLDVFHLLIESPGSIAFKLTEEHGAVIYYTTMLCFFVGAAFMLQYARRKWVRVFTVILIVLFALGLLAITRREMLLLVFAWGFVHVLTQKKIRPAVLISITLVCVLAIFTTTMLFRSIDIVKDPMAYFLSGEFEPFRFALYLIGHWIDEGGVYYSPLTYVVPFSDPTVLAESTNCKLVQDFLHNDMCLGSYTITVFAAFLYFGFLFPLIFYMLAVWSVKQAGYWLNENNSPLSSFLYAFFMLRLVLFIRNGELFNSVIDSIVLAVLVTIFYASTGWKAIWRVSERFVATPTPM